MTLVIRADASSEIGAGHFMRCLALAEAWQERGGDAIFLSRCDSRSLLLRAESKHIRVEKLPLDTAEERDRERTLRLLDRLAANGSELAVCMDGYHFTPAYHAAVRGAGYPLLLIDDCSHLSIYDADILLNQNLGAASLRYTTAPETIRFFGPRYALLRSEFRNRPRVQRTVPGVARRVLVTMGGADRANVTSRVIRALAQSRIEPLECLIVVGGANEHGEALREAVETARDRSAIDFRLSRAVEDMPALMQWADLVISAAGSTCWELCYMGAPSLVLAVADNQRAMAERLAEREAVVNAGWHQAISEDELVKAIDLLADDAEHRTRLSRNASRLVDGRGATRVADVMADLATLRRRIGEVRLRRAEPRDLMSLWQLANDPQVRGNAFSPEPISLDQHTEWFEKKIASDATAIWVLALDSEMVGQIRYDRVSPAVAEIDFSVAAPYRGKGVGTRLLRMTKDIARDRLGVTVVRGVVRIANGASARAFQKAEFRQRGQESVHGESCWIFEASIAEEGRLA